MTSPFGSVIWLTTPQWYWKDVVWPFWARVATLPHVPEEVLQTSRVNVVVTPPIVSEVLKPVAS